MRKRKKKRKKKISKKIDEDTAQAQRQVSDKKVR
jgi:hypothetical protein